MKDPVKIDKGSPERFGHSWDIFNEILPIHQEQFNRWTSGISHDEWQNKRILDAGCGIGRNSYWAFQNGISSAVCIDVDKRTLNHAKNNLEEYDAKIDFQSIYELPYENEFDIAFCIGVIHHLENPKLAIQNLIKATKPGGKVLIWVYGYENNEWVVKYFNPFRKLFFSKLPLPIVYSLSYPLTSLLWLALRLGLGKIAYFKLLKQFSFRQIQVIVYDQMIPKIAHYYTREEALNLLSETNLRDVKIYWVNEMSWTVVGEK